MDISVETENALHMLEGLIGGMKINDRIGEGEIRELKEWCDRYRGAVAVYPFSGVISFAERILSDGVVTQAEMDDLAWFLDQLETNHGHDGNDPSDLKRFAGMLIAIASDGVVDNHELAVIRDWFVNNGVPREDGALRDLGLAVSAMRTDSNVFTDEERRIALEKIQAFHAEEEA